MENNLPKEWEGILNPIKLKTTLIKAGIYLVSYETLKNTIVDKLKDLYSIRWEYDEHTGKIISVQSPDFKNKVISLYPKDEFQACCLWFYNRNAINENDLENIALIRRQRNIIAHELEKFITAELNINEERLKSLVSISNKIDRWWLKEVELPTDPDFNPDELKQIDWDAATGGNSFLLEILETVFNGDDETLKKIHSLFTLAYSKKSG